MAVMLYSWEGNRGPGRSNGSLLIGFMTNVTCKLSASEPQISTGPYSP